MSFTRAGNVPGVGWVDDSDLVRFHATNLGMTTAGDFSLFFDGSDVGLSSSSEDVDAIEIAGPGLLFLSTVGSFRASGESGANEDIIVCRDADLGSDSDCEEFEVAFEGSDAELGRGSENVDAFSFSFSISGPVIPGGPVGTFAVDPGAAVFSTNGDFRAGGAFGDDDDLFACEGRLDDCEDDPDFDVIFRGSRHGVIGVDIEAIELVPPLPVIPPPLPETDLALTKVDAPDPVDFPGTITYTLTVTNNGPNPATDFFVEEFLDTNVDLVSAPPECAVPPAQFLCAIPSLAVGSSIDLTVTVAPRVGGIVVFNGAGRERSRPDRPRSLQQLRPGRDRGEPGPG